MAYIQPESSLAIDVNSGMLNNPGYNYYYVEAGPNAVTNGTNLRDTYALAALLTPGGNP